MDRDFLRRGGSHLYERSCDFSRLVKTKNLVTPAFSRVRKKFSKNRFLEDETNNALRVVEETLDPTEERGKKQMKKQVPAKSNAGSLTRSGHPGSQQSRSWSKLRSGALTTWAERSRKHIIYLSLQLKQRSNSEGDKKEKEASLDGENHQDFDSSSQFEKSESHGRRAMSGGDWEDTKNAALHHLGLSEATIAVLKTRKRALEKQKHTTDEKLVSKERDNLKRELKKASRDNEDSAYGSGRYNDYNYGSNALQASIGSRDFNLLKVQLEKSLLEIQSLRKHNQEMSRKYESAAKEADYYRKQEKAVYGSLQSLRMQYEEVIAEKKKLEHEVSSLQNMMEDDRKEIAELRRHQQEAMSQEGSGEAINQLYLSTVQKYESVKDDYDSLRKRYSELASQHSTNVSKLDQTQEEINRLNDRNDEVLREKICLKQQCTEAIRQWDIALRDKKQLEEELTKSREKSEELVKELNVHLLQRQSLSKDLKKLQEERNTVMTEYSLVMGERDQVHKEMDKLQEELNQSNSITKAHIQTVKEKEKERDSLMLQLETLQREISSALHDRDVALKELSEMREQYGDGENSAKHYFEQGDVYSQHREHNVAELSSVGSSNSPYSSRGSKERMDDLDKANQEIERLRKTVEKLQGELQGSLTEVAISQRRRDWAFAERDKIIRERDSIRTLSDNLRREKDRAVAKLAEALKDSDDIRKQKNELSKHLKLLKENFDVEKSESKALQDLHGQRPKDPKVTEQTSQSDIQDMHIFVGNYCEMRGNVGFEVSAVPRADDSSVISVSVVHRDSPFYGKIRLKDEVIRVNGLDCQALSTEDCIPSVYRAVHTGGIWTNITIRRTNKFLRDSVHTSELQCPPGIYSGITLLPGVYIAAIENNSPAASDVTLNIGDRVININGKNVDGMGVSYKDAQELLHAGAGDALTVTTMRCCPCLDSKSCTSDYHSLSSKGSSNKYLMGFTPSTDDDKWHKSNLDEENRIALAELDSVINSYHKSHTAKRSKKKEKTGGTWPKYKGGVLSTYSRNGAPNLDRYFVDNQKSKEYKISEDRDNYQGPDYNFQTNAAEAKREEPENLLSSLPSDASLDYSVRSGNVGKEELEHYVKKNIVKYPLSDSESPTNISPTHQPQQPLSLPVTYGYRHLSRHLTSDRHSGLYSPFAPLSPFSPFNVIPARHPHTTVNSTAVTTTTSPSIYSTVMPVHPYLPSSRSGDSLSPSHDMHNQPSVVSPSTVGHEKFHHRSNASPSTINHDRLFNIFSSSYSSNRERPRIGVSPLHMDRGYTSSVASTIHERELQDIPHCPVLNDRNKRHPIYHKTEDHFLPPSTMPPSYNDYQRNVTTMPRRRDEDKMRLSSTLGGLFKANSSEVRSPITLSSSPANQIPQQIYFSVHNRQFSNFHYYHKKPETGEIRNIVLEKDTEPLGIQIRCMKNGGVFVSAVTVNSLAEQVGIIVGDQLLEVCGINMRSATTVTASTVLSQCGKSVTILVQNNVDKYDELNKDWRDSCSGSSLLGHSRDATPRNSPPVIRNNSPPVIHNTPPVFNASVISPNTHQCKTSPSVYAREGPPFPNSERMSSLTREDSLLSRHSLNRDPNVSSLYRQDTFKRNKESEAPLLDTRSATLPTRQNSSGSKGTTLPTRQNSSGSKGTTLPTRQNSNGSKGSGSSRSKQGRRNKEDLPRTVFLEVNKGSLGVRLVGGNFSGVFIHVVLPDSPASRASLKPGDRILEYNKHDLRYATAEQASYELAKPADTVSILVQYDARGYNVAMEQPGDSFYIRALFDNPGCEATQQLSFRKDDILYVDNTLYNSVPGVWRAWKVDENGHKKTWGTIPSKDKVEEAIIQKGGNNGSGVDLSTIPFAGGTVLSSIGVDSSKRGNTTARRSFFRRKKHSRSSSRDSKELASFSDASLNSYGVESASSVVEEAFIPSAYLRVERLDYQVQRPLMLLGPLWEFVADRLCHDYPVEYAKCIPEVNQRASGEQLEAALLGGLVVDYRRRGNGAWDVTTLQQIQESQCHSVLDLSLSAVENLHKHNIYPIIVLLKFRSMKQVREMCDTLDRNMPSKISPKEAKERFEMSSKLETECKGLVSAVVPAVANMAYMCTQIKACVDSEQRKTLWVPEH